MSFHFNPLDHPEAEISRIYFCQLAGRSRVTAYRLERVDPMWPKPVKRGRRVFYKAADCKRYLMSARAQEVTP
jgi:predicted DNA-binding transcriptional regulator AlpA